METLVAITLLLIAIGGPMYAVSQSLASAIYARDQITAFYLAQDAVEYIRDMRDNNALGNNPDWIAGLSSGSYLPSDGTVGTPFNIDTSRAVSNGSIIPCSGSGCDAMNYDSSTGAVSSGIYSYGTSPGGSVVQSPFTRTITLQKVDIRQVPTHEILLTVDISWKANIAGAKKEFKIVETLTNWVQS